MKCSGRENYRYEGGDGNLISKQSGIPPGNFDPAVGGDSPTIWWNVRLTECMVRVWRSKSTLDKNISPQSSQNTTSSSSPILHIKKSEIIKINNNYAEKSGHVHNWYEDWGQEGVPKIVL